MVRAPLVLEGLKDPLRRRVPLLRMVPPVLALFPGKREDTPAAGIAEGQRSGAAESRGQCHRLPVQVKVDRGR